MRLRSYIFNVIDYCLYCGECNHRQQACRYGMPVNCYRCGLEGHKEKFCGTYYWGGGEEGGHSPLSCCFYQLIRTVYFNDGNVGTSHHSESQIYDIDVYLSGIKDTLRSENCWCYHEVGQTPGDGHCLIHAVIMSIKSQFPHVAQLHYQMLIDCIR